MKRRLALLPLILLLGACATPDPEAAQAADRQEVSAQVQERIGDLPAPLGADREAVATATEALLAEGPVNVERGLALALLHHPKLRERFAELGIVRADLLQAGLLANPSLSTDLMEFDAGTELESSLLFPLMSLFRRAAREAEAGALHEAALARTVDAVLALKLDLELAFLDLGSAREAFRIQESVVAAAEASASLEATLYAAGNTKDEDLLRARLAASRARLDLAQREAEVFGAEENVLERLGVHGALAHVPLMAEPPHVRLPDALSAGLESRAVAQSLALRAEHAEAVALAQSLGLSEAEGLLPSLDLGPSYMREPDGEDIFGLMAHLELPLFDRGEARVAGARARLAAKLEHHRGLALMVRSEARRLRDRLRIEAARAQTLSEEYVPLATQVLGAVLRDYNAMQIGAMTVLDEKIAELMARREALLAHQAAARTAARLQALLTGHYAGRSAAMAVPMASPSAAGNDGDH